MLLVISFSSLSFPHLPSLLSPLLCTVLLVISHLSHSLTFPSLISPLLCTILLVISCVSDREGRKSRSRGGPKSNSQSLSESQLLGSQLIGRLHNRKEIWGMIIVMMIFVIMMIIKEMKEHLTQPLLCSILFSFVVLWLYYILDFGSCTSMSSFNHITLYWQHLTQPHPCPLKWYSSISNCYFLFTPSHSSFSFFLSFFLSFSEGDRFRVEHVIINFLSNAVKFSPDGSEIIIQISGRNPHSEARDEPRKIPEGLSHRGTKGAGKEKEKDKEKDMRTLWSRSSSFANQDCKYCTVPYRTATCNTSQFSFPLAYLYFVMICSMCCSNWALYYTARHALSCDVMWCHVMSCHALSCDAIACHVVHQAILFMPFTPLTFSNFPVSPTILLNFCYD